MTSYQFFDPDTPGGAGTVRLIRGVLDTQASQAAGEELFRLAAASERRELRVDLGNVSFLGAAMLGRFVAVHVEMRGTGRRLALHNVPPLACEIFQAARLTELLGVQPARTKTVMVVEDDPTAREGLKALLEGEGYTVACAADGREALDHLRHVGLPALILLDLVMGGMDGWQFRREQGLDPVLAPVPVVIVSATADVSRSAASLGAAGFVRKPVTLDALLEAIRQHC